MPEFEPLHEGWRLLGQKAYKQAHAYCREIAIKDPKHADAYYILGIISYEHHDFERALKLFEVAIQNQHPAPGPEVQAARCLGHLNRSKEALAYIEAAQRQDPKDGYTLASIAATLSRLDRHEEAAIFHRKATNAEPNNPGHWFNLGSALQFNGDVDGASQAYQRALRLAPHFTPALVHLTLMAGSQDSRHYREQLETAWNNRHPQDIEGGLQVAHGLAKICEDTGQTKQAMDWLNKGKALVRKAVPSRKQADAASFAAAKKLSRTLQIAATAQGDGPVFIVGLPRTGTTLLDRIISSHSEIISAGERTEFGALFKQSASVRAALPADAAVLERAPHVDLKAVGDAYVENLRAILGAPSRFTDKMPINVLLAPVILSAIADAKIICLRRHPADSVLSMYRQLFAVSALHNRCAYDLADLGNYVADFYDLLDAFIAALPEDRFMIMDYEALVQSPDAEVRRTLTFCSLSYEAECLSFHNNPAPVGTASVGQVRRPLYTSAVGRWTHYEDSLTAALDILRQRGKLKA